MLLLTMNIGHERFAIDALQVSEVIPLVTLERIPRVDDCIRGMFNYRGTPIPVIDLCVFFENRPCHDNLGSRIIITEIDTAHHQKKTVGLLAEHVTEVVKCNPAELTRNGIRAEHAPFLDKVYHHIDGLVQIIDVKRVVPESIKQQITDIESTV